MKYTIELTNKQKAQMDCIIDIVHRYVGFNPKLEPIKATNVEDTSEYQIGYKVGFEDGKKQAIEEIPELANKENEIYNDRYNKGLEDGYKGYRYIKQWFASTCFFDTEDILFPEYKRRQADTCCLEDIITDVGFSEVLNRVKAYEEKKKAEDESIKVGDEVFITGLKDLETIGVITMLANNNYTVICLINGSEMARVTKNDIKPTGRHFEEISQLLDKLRGDK